MINADLFCCFKIFFYIRPDWGIEREEKRRKLPINEGILCGNEQISIESITFKFTSLKRFSCLASVKREKELAVNAIGRLASMLPHIITEREVSLVKDEWKILQTEEIPDDWYMENSGQQKRIDTYWAKVFEIRTETGDLKYSLLSKVVKSFLAMPNGNANVERSLLDNKKTLTSGRTNMTKETF